MQLPISKFLPLFVLVTIAAPVVLAAPRDELFFTMTHISRAS
jgi:hypothetical protein